jgi:RHS repeat-associated protein
VIENYRYDVVGAPTINGGALTSSAYNNRFMFTGREYTSTFGIYEYRARAYHPGLGRFTGEDPKGFDAGDYNLFRYVTNDPLDKTDPMGLDGLIDVDPSNPYNITIHGRFSFHAPFVDAQAARFRGAVAGEFSNPIGRYHVTYDPKTGPVTDVYYSNSGSKTLRGGNETSILWNPAEYRNPTDAVHEGAGHNFGAGHSCDDGSCVMSGPNVRANPGTHLTETDIKSMIDRKGQASVGPIANSPTMRGPNAGAMGSVRYSQARGLAGMTSIGNGYFTNRNGGVFTNQAFQSAAGNYGAWNANHFGAFQSSPFGGDAEGGQAENPHPVPRWLY